MMELPDHWYVVAEPRELSARRPNSLRRHGREWVVWRKADGSWLMKQDRCPHRSARLSQGKIHNDCVVCPFHGFRFDSTGRCSHVPEMGREAPGLKIESHTLYEAHGFLWWKRGSVSTESPPWFEELSGGSWGTHDARQWKQHVSRCIENQLDYAHLPFVHANTIGAKMDVRKTVEFISTENDIRMIMSRAEKGGQEATGIRFLYPGLWRLKISPKMQAFIAFVAVDDQTTRIYLRTYQSMVTWIGLRHLVGWAMKLSNRVILRQDLSVVLGQTPQDVRDLNEANRETLFPSDQAIKSFRKWLERV